MGRPKLLMEFDGEIAHPSRRDGPAPGRGRANRRRHTGRCARGRCDRRRGRRGRGRGAGPRDQPAEMRDSVELGLAASTPIRGPSACCSCPAMSRASAPTWSPVWWMPPGTHPGRIVIPDSRGPSRTSDRPPLGDRARHSRHPRRRRHQRARRQASRPCSSCRSPRPAELSTSTRPTTSYAGRPLLLTNAHVPTPQ